MSLFSFLVAQQGGALPNQPANLNPGGSSVNQPVTTTPTSTYIPPQQTTQPVYQSDPTPQLNDDLTPLDFGTQLDTGFGTLSLIDLVQMFVVYAFIIAAALSAIFIFIGGLNFILSGGNDEKISKAVKTIRYSIIGLVITILSFTFVTIVGRVFGLNFLDYLSYDQIKASIDRLVQTGGTTNSSSNQFNPRGR